MMVAAAGLLLRSSPPLFTLSQNTLSFLKTPGAVHFYLSSLKPARQGCSGFPRETTQMQDLALLSQGPEGSLCLSWTGRLRRRLSGSITLSSSKERHANHPLTVRPSNILSSEHGSQHSICDKDKLSHKWNSGWGWEQYLTHGKGNASQITAHH